MTLDVPNNLGDALTSKLMETCFFNFKEPGLAYQSPIGRKAYEKLNRFLVKKHEDLGGVEIRLPTCMKKDVLEKGEEIPESFAKKMVSLPSPMKDYILTTTHEMDVLDYVAQEKISHNNLPLHLFATQRIIRPIKDPKGILKCRDFGVILMLSINKNEACFTNSLTKYQTICEDIFKNLNIEFQKKTNYGIERTKPNEGFDLEYFYLGSEGDNLEISSSGQRIKALSLAMAYRYKPKDTLVSLVSENNKIEKPTVGTYAIGLERLMYATFDCTRDKVGFALPAQIRPFDVSVLVFPSSGNSEFETAEKIYAILKKSDHSVMLDDRKGTNRVKKARFSDFIGIPEKVIVSPSGIRIVSRGMAEGKRFSSIEETVNYLNKDMEYTS